MTIEVSMAWSLLEKMLHGFGVRWGGVDLRLSAAAALLASSASAGVVYLQREETLSANGVVSLMSVLNDIYHLGVEAGRDQRRKGVGA